MAVSTQRVEGWDTLLWNVSRQHQAPLDLLKALMRGLGDRARLQYGSVWLNEIGTLTLDRAGRETRVAWLDGPARGDRGPGHGAGMLHASPVDEAVHAAETQNPAGRYSENAPRAAGGLPSLTLPVAYADTTIGEVHLRWQAHPEEEGLALCREFTRLCRYLAKRHEVQRWSERRLGRPLLPVGVSPTLQELEAFVEKASHSGLPVLLHGEFGTEKALFAAAIHSCGPRRDGPFVEVSCADPAGAPASWFEQARGGTLYLSGIDELPLPLQQQIPQHMQSHLGQWLAPSGGTGPRIIASTTASLAERVAEGGFSRRLFVELDFLPATVPPLRQRPADIEPLVLSTLARHGYRAPRHNDTLIAVCQAHSWPENLFELERVIARLAVLSDGEPIGRAEVLRHAPWVLAEQSAGSGNGVGLEEAEAGEDREDSDPAVLDRWVRCALTHDAASLNRLHDSVKKALLYLGEHYAEPVSLGQLARQAHVSPSHLTFLFRSALGTAFKPFLLRIRVHKAKELLLGNGRQRITEVALAVGFTDLSHFEKSFRRVVGQSAREFRRGVDGS